MATRRLRRKAAVVAAAPAKVSTPSPAPESLTVTGLVAGIRVRLAGLEAFVELNGQQGTLLSFDEQRGRWQVRLESGLVKNVRAGNLTNLSESTLPADGKPEKGVTGPNTIFSIPRFPSNCQLPGPSNVIAFGFHRDYRATPKQELQRNRTWTPKARE